MKDFILKTLNKLEEVIGINSPEIIILMYHNVSQKNGIVDIKFSNFKKQINFLIKNKYKFVSLSEIEDYVNGEIDLPKAISLTFDDGYNDLLETALPFLAKNNIPASLFVLSDPKNANRKELSNSNELLNIKELKKLGKNYSVNCHTATHPNLTAKNINLNLEIKQSKASLEKIMNTQVNYFAYPKGKYNQDVLNVVEKSGFKLALSAKFGSITRESNPLLLPRVGVDQSHSLEQFKSLFKVWYHTVHPIRIMLYYTSKLFNYYE